MNKRFSILAASLIGASSSLASAAQLSDDFSIALTAGVFSDYWSRGMSQTKGDPALQASATLIHSSGLYAGVWSSNVDFGNGSKTRQEIDYYAGYFWQISDDVSLDLAYYQYEYPKQSFSNYSEYYAKLSAYGFNIGGYYSDDLFDDQSYLYSFAGYTANLPHEIKLDLTYGKVDYKDPVFVNGSGQTRDSYNLWLAKVSKPLFGFVWSAAYGDTDLSRQECMSFNGYDDICSSTVIFGVEKSF
ncbi:MULTISPECIES: TorF family putative porin [unclassified Pseudomonas]|uniref:TorF family putative porin n=1 Tax=unclassified Pseudomonas TaxID=196821 RepID=UPI0011A51393|nr:MULTISPECIES: TorF family putative porin [unclassified Pseudomonas]MCE5988793.1 TorF family putative porin [Pseudomonas sp. LM20]